MKRSFNTKSYSLVLLACLLASVFAQCPTFYADYNQQGSSFQLCSSNNVPASFNDQVSSFVIPAGYQIRLHGDAGFSGEFWGLYDKGSYNVPTSFNDKLSSVSVFRTQNFEPRCPTFYADLDLQGDSFQLCSSSNNLPSQWNDRISSFVIPEGFSVQLYADNNKGGDLRGPYTEGLYNVPSSFNDQASSVVVNDYKDNNSDNDNSPDVRCPTFYTDVNQQGSKFQLCSSSNVPDGFNDKVSSFVIPAGYSVQLFPDYNNGGDQWGPYTEGAYDVAREFNDQLSSVFISRNTDSHSDNDKNDNNYKNPRSDNDQNNNYNNHNNPRSDNDNYNNNNQQGYKPSNNNQNENNNGKNNNDKNYNNPRSDNDQNNGYNNNNQQGYKPSNNNQNGNNNNNKNDNNQNQQGYKPNNNNQNGNNNNNNKNDNDNNQQGYKPSNNNQNGNNNNKNDNDNNQQGSKPSSNNQNKNNNGKNNNDNNQQASKPGSNDQNGNNNKQNQQGARPTYNQNQNNATMPAGNNNNDHRQRGN